MDDAVSGPWLIDPETRLQLRMKELRRKLELGDFEEAVLEAEELLDEVPDYPDALYLLGEALLDANDPEGAVMAFERHLQVVGEDLESLLRLGLARFEICDLEGAEEVIREVTRRQPENALGHYQLALVLEAQERKTDAVREVILANQLDPISFPLPNPWKKEEWNDAIRDALELLSPEFRRFWSDVDMRLETAPRMEDLHVEDPPLSPRTTGMFVGEPPQDPETALRPEAMRFFLRNLEKAADYEELVDWVSTALEREACEWLGIVPDDTI